MNLPKLYHGAPDTNLISVETAQGWNNYCQKDQDQQREHFWYKQAFYMLRVFWLWKLAWNFQIPCLYRLLHEVKNLANLEIQAKGSSGGNIKFYITIRVRGFIQRAAIRETSRTSEKEECFPGPLTNSSCHFAFRLKNYHHYLS